MLAVIYARYSSTAQREESAEIQLNSCYAHAEREGYTVVGKYVDEALTGRNDERPQFQKMIRDSQKSKFNRVIVHRLDRFSRDKYDNAHYKRILKKNNIKVVSATEPISEDSTGVLMEAILEGFAEYYSIELGEKIKRGHALNAEKGLANGACVPLGYKIGIVDGEKKYVLDEEKAPIVKEIFTKYVNGMRIKEICDDLNSRQIKSSKGAAFNKNSMHTLLKNEKYLGIYIYGGVRTEGGMPQIIDKELFDKVQEKMIQNKKLPARSRAKVEYLLTTRLYCGHCKEMMTGFSGTGKLGRVYRYYVCKGANKGLCNKKRASKDYIEDTVIDECRKLLTEKNISRIAKEVVKIVESYDDRSEIIRIEKYIKKLQKEKENQMKSLRACDIEDVRGMIFEDLSRISAELKELEVQLDVENARRENISEEKVEKFLTTLAKGDIMDVVYRKSLIKTLVNKIFLYDDRFTITFNSGDEAVTIDDVLLEHIEKNLDNRFCLSDTIVQRGARAGNFC
jgi:DNA invertase Pin-like site-specific DNA recombinase